MERDAQQFLVRSWFVCIGAIFVFLNILTPIESALAQSRSKSFFEALSFEIFSDGRSDSSYGLNGFGNSFTGFSCEYRTSEFPVGREFFCELSCEQAPLKDDFLASMDFRLDLFKSRLGSLSCGGSCFVDMQTGYTEASARLTYAWQLGDLVNFGDSFGGSLLSKCGFQADWSVDETGSSRGEVSLILGGISF